jgi:hypothetical protein
MAGGPERSCGAGKGRQSAAAPTCAALAPPQIVRKAAACPTNRSRHERQGGAINQPCRSRQISCTNGSVTPYSPWPTRISTLAAISSFTTGWISSTRTSRPIASL